MRRVGIQRTAGAVRVHAVQLGQLEGGGDVDDGASL